jgi:RNA polymerase sigma-70 factor (ECF subfamily)
MLWRLAGGFAPEAEREDLLQEILVQIWLALPRFEGNAKLSTWAYRVALFCALNWQRKERRSPRKTPLEHAPEPTTAAPSFEQKETLAQVYALLRTMREADRTVLLLALEETPRAEMAEILGISENAAQVRLHRARERLENLLKTSAQ